MKNTTSNNIEMKYNLQKINEAILEDKQIQQLQAEKVKIYELAMPTFILKDGKAERIDIDETNHPRLSKINEMIEFRMQQLKDAYLNIH